jgi:hypothetical protein
MIFVFCCESNIDRSKEQVSPWLPITRNEVLTHDNLDGDCSSPCPCENWCRNSAQSALWGRRKNDSFFATLAGGKTGIFSKNCPLGLGQERPNKCRDKNHENEFLGLKAKLAPSLWGTLVERW